MDVLYLWRILLGISAHLDPFSHFQRMTHLPQQIPLDVKFWTCQHILSSFQIPPKKGYMFGCSLPQSPLLLPLLPTLPTYTSGFIYTNYFSLASLVFVLLSLTLTLSVYFRNAPSYCISPLTLLLCLHHYPNYPNFSLECIFLHLPFLSSHCCHHTEMLPTLSTSICTGLLKWVSLFTCKFLL